jgi:predicted nucleotidyltransferase
MKKMTKECMFDQRTITNILQRHLSLNEQVFAFGSRVKGTARKNSDLDLVIKAENALPLQKITAIKEDFANSDILFRVDISDWNLLSDSFKRCIDNEKLLIFGLSTGGQ